MFYVSKTGHYFFNIETNITARGHYQYGLEIAPITLLSMKLDFCLLYCDSMGVLFEINLEKKQGTSFPMMKNRI